MPHLGERALNDAASTRVRIIKAEARAKQSRLPSQVLVGTPLLRSAPDAMDALARLHVAGWRIADDGDPYQPGGPEL